MKKLLFLLIIILCSLLLAPCSLQSQTIPPPFINYQAVLYDVNGANPNSPLTNQSFSTFVNINDELGNLLYREEHYASTDANGLITVKMGDGLYTAGPITNFNQIDWGVGKYYLVVDFDINGTISSTAPEQLVTVPYSFYAGKAGNGMTAVADNGNGTLTFTYENGATYTTPTLVGIQGPAGPVGPSGPSGASGTAGTDGQSAYDLWLGQGNTGTVQDFLSTSAYQIWLAQGNTGTAQDFLNTLVGPQGPQGIQGPAGNDGSTGPQGPIGITGPAGPAGAQGLTGPDGRSAYEIALLNGFVGTETQWLLSLVGATGPQGIQGATGPSGAIGLTGPVGAQGLPGTNGTDGADGAVGAQGPQGIQGPIGLTGPAGPQGVQGPAGPSGASGTAGATGAQGPQGPIGLTGAEGPQGPIGLTGATGPQGPQGPIGLTGAEGPQGPIGLTGATGPQGPQGIQGPAGAASSNGIGVRLGFSNSTTWVCPAGVTEITVQLWGGGGGGGAGSRPSGYAGCKPCNNSILAESSGSGGNGGNGGYNRVAITVVPGNTYTITVGNGGVGGVASTTDCSNAYYGPQTLSAATNGGVTSFHGLINAPGGNAGQNGDVNGGCNNGLAGSNGVVTNYSASASTFFSFSNTSPNSYVPAGYSATPLTVNCCSNGGIGGVRGTYACPYGNFCATSGTAGEKGYLIISY